MKSQGTVPTCSIDLEHYEELNEEYLEEEDEQEEVRTRSKARKRRVGEMFRRE